MTDFAKFNASTHPIVKLEDDWNNMLDHALEKGVSYIVRSNGDFYEAFNGTTGKLSYGGSGDEGEKDGTDNDAVINAALADCYAEGGGSVLIKNDMGTIDAPILVKDKVSLLGYGKISKITTDGSIHHIEVVGVNPYPADYQGCVVSGLYLLGPESGTKAGIYATDLHNSIFRDNWIDSCGYGIHLKGTVMNDADNNVIANNQIRFSAKHGIFLEGNPYETVQENAIYGNIIETQSEIGIYAACAHNTIIGNTVEESHTYGLYLIGKENTITGNTIRESFRHGILIDGNNEITPVASGSGNTIIGNIILDNDFNNTATYDGISLIQDADDNVISNNTIRDNDRHQIYVGADCDDNIIKDNILLSSDGGTIATVSKANIIKDNLGFNPVGILTNPYPASSGNISNSSADQNFPSDEQKYVVKETPKTIVVSGGTIDAIWIDDVLTGLTSGVFKLGINEYIHVYWSVVPTVNRVWVE